MVLVLWSGSGKCAVLLLRGMAEGAAMALQPEHQKNLPSGQEPRVSMGRLGGMAKLTDFPVPSLALGLTVSWLLKVSPMCTFPA